MRELDQLSQHVGNAIVTAAPEESVTETGQPATSTGTGPPINFIGPSTTGAAGRRVNDAERVRARRANMTSSQREAARRRNTEQQRLRRARQREEQRQVEWEQNRLHQEGRRARQSQEERNRDREQNAAARVDRRSQQTEEERDQKRERNREQQVHRRGELPEDALEDERERVRIRRRTDHRCEALASHEDFNPSMVTGPHVVDGRHRLPPTTVCDLCNAWKWPGESKVGCCLEGKVKLSPLRPAPPRLLQLYEDNEFRKHVRAYNQAFAFTSIGASCSNRNVFQDVRQDQSVAGEHGVYTYRIQGAMGHYLGSLLPYIDRNTGERTAPKFAQIYIVDPDMQRRAQRRQGIFADLDPVALLDIEQKMQTHNPFAQQFLTFGEKVREHNTDGVVDVVSRLHEKASSPGTYNLPTVSEVGATMIEDGNLDQPRDLLLFTRQHRLMRLFETNSMYDPLQYPLLLPYGELGWTFTDTYEDGAVRRGKREMSLWEHIAYRLYQKVDDGSALHEGGRLFQQYCVDQRAKCEQEQLRWVATHQNEFRADQYRGVRDALLDETTIELGEGERLLSEYDRSTGELVHPDRARSRNRHFLNQVGKKVILPSSHSGSPRQMYHSYLDSMAMVREYGKPDLFITKTCNPTWDEIKEKLPEGQTAQDRPDIVARVWQQKLGALLKDLDEGVLGHVVARIYVVEFQKRGLPHAHILTILADEDKPRTRQNIDKLVSAEVPDRETNPDLYETVMMCMMHSPCGAANPTCACMKDGKCTKRYPKPLVEVTRSNEDGFPVYRRRRRPAGVLKFNSKEYDNATVNPWVVPYNPYLSQKYNCHINVEVRTDITAVKYLYKYVHKGSDKAMITVETVQGEGDATRREPNEILRFLNARYISPVEACMRLLDYSVQGKNHAITQLTVHLENEQVVTFRSSDDPNRVLTRGSRTMLTAFFELCSSQHEDNEVAKTIVYQDVPKFFKWDDKRKTWVRRKRYHPALGRLVHVSPRDKERFYMRVLLTHRKGPTSFADLRKVGDQVCPSHHAAALQLGYLEDDTEWIACMEEAVSFKLPYQLRQLFVTLLVYSQVSGIRSLWDRFYTELSRDFANKLRTYQLPDKDDNIKFNTLNSLHDLLQASGIELADFSELSQLNEFPDLVRVSLRENNLIHREMTYDRSKLQAIVDHEVQLNQGQRAIYNEVIQAVETPTADNKLFFIDGPGGTGKSTLIRHLLAKVRVLGKIAIAVASSGIASLLQMGGRTEHYTFKIPLKLNKNSTYSINKGSHLQELIQKASLIIWDEAPMTHRHAFEAVDRTLRDLMDNEDEPFGGKVVVLSGDFRQILPVVVRGTPAETIDACVKSSELWSHFRTLKLTENMHVQSADNELTAEEVSAFSEFLLRVGEGRHDVNPSLGSDYIKLPRDMLIERPPEEETEDDDDEEIRPGSIPKGLNRIIDEMYADINNPEVATDEYFANRTILTTTNAVVRRINDTVAQRLEGVSHEYLSNDSVEEDGQGNLFEPEFLPIVNINGIPPHKLTLKVGAPIMLMRNLNPDLGLCNGTRLRVVELKPHVIRASIMTGERQGQHVLIPRIVFVSDGDAREFPFQLRRKQFPVQPAFTMTINKAQGQTVENLGLYLWTPCFSHGQLYVGLSRVTARSRLKALIEHPELEEEDGAYTQYIVYRQIFE